MVKLQFVGTMVRYEKRNNSYYGNPKYMGVFENENGEVLVGTTASNASCGYGFLNNASKVQKITYHVTKSGNVIIDYIEEV